MAVPKTLTITPDQLEEKLRQICEEAGYPFDISRFSGGFDDRTAVDEPPSLRVRIALPRRSAATSLPIDPA
jgi:hypothetical protein